MNSESAQSSNNRLLDNDELSQPDKQIKQDNRLILRDPIYLSKYEEETLNLACTEKSCDIKESKNRNTYTDFVAKFEIPFEQFEKEKTTFIEKLISKNKETYNFSLSNIPYEGTLSSSLIFLFQNKQGLSDEEFKNEVLAYENNFIIKNSEEEEKLKEKKCDEFFKSNEENKENHKNDLTNEQYHSKNKEELNVENIIENSNLINPHFNLENNLPKSNNANSNNDNEKNICNKKDYENNKNMDIDQCIDMNLITLNKTEHAKDHQPLRGTYYKTIEESREKRNKNFINNGNPKSEEEKQMDISNEIDLELNSRDTYEIQINFYFSDFKFIQKTCQKIMEGEIIEIIIDIPSNFYSSFKGEGVYIVVDLAIRKNYDASVRHNGIINEAMTCYMNSLIQTLFNIGYFRKAVFQIPFDPLENLSESVVYSLQRLFYDLMKEKNPASTNKLISSFGWSRDDIFIQHDVQEFNLMLNDLMENKMKGTKSEGTFKFLFEGKSENYIECLDIPYRSNKEEKFYDLQLTVKGCKNIYESLEKYTEVEMLDGDNLYEAEGHGKHRAKKGVRFLEFPRVLMFQLKRFEYNPMKETMEKINEMFEFPDELVLDDFISNENKEQNNKEFKSNDSNEKKKKYQYSLYSVVVHKGSIDRGHYYAFIKPENGNQWYQFNDEIVRKADLYEVFSNNFGGIFKIFKHKEKGIITEITQKSDGNAYLLVYIRKDLREEILQKVTDEDIPLPLIERFKKEKEYEKRQIMLRIRSKKNIDIHLFSKEILLNHFYLGAMPSFLELQEITELLNNVSAWTKISVPKDMKIIELREYISKCLNIPGKYILLYTYVLRDQKNIYRNILKRHDFKMHLIDENAMRDQKITSINSYNESKPVLRNHIFIFIDFALKNPKDVLMENHKNITKENQILLNQLQNFELNIFERNELFDLEKDKNFEDIAETEYVIDEVQQKMIYYKFDNFWKFKYQEDLSLQVFELLKYNDSDYDNFKLFIIKDIVELNEEPKLKIVNSFSLPVDKNSDNYILQNLIKYSKDYTYISQLMENLERDEFKDMNIGIYLETTVFDEETSSILKKLIYLNQKKEKLFYKNMKKEILESNYEKENNNENSNLMDIEENQTSKIYNINSKKNINKQNFSEKVLNKENSINNNPIVKNDDNNFNSNQFKKNYSQEENKISKSQDSKIKEDNNDLNNYNKEKLQNEYDEKDDIRGNDNSFNNKEGLSSENKTDSQKNNEVNCSASSSKSAISLNISSGNKESSKSKNDESIISLEIQNSENNLSINSKSKNNRAQLKDNSYKNKLQNSPSDNNSMVNNQDSYSEEQEKKRNINNSFIKGIKNSTIGNTNKNTRIKSHRKVLGVKRNLQNDKEITYQNISNYNRENRNDFSNGENNINNENNESNNCKLKPNNNLNEESDESLTQEDILIIQQDISYLDEFLFKLFNVKNQKIIDLKINLYNNTIKKDSSDQYINKDFNIPNKNFNNNVNENKHNPIENYESYLDNSFYSAFSKCNSDALILYLFPEENNNLIVLEKMCSKNAISCFFENLHNSVYIPVEFYFSNKSHPLINHKGSNKIKIRLDDELDQIKNRVLNLFSFNLQYFNLEHLFYQEEITKNIYFFTERRELLNLSEFISRVNTDYFLVRTSVNIEHIANNSTNNYLLSIFNKYELLKYMDSKDALYKLSVHLLSLKLKNTRNFINKDITLYDIDNNPITKIYFCFPSELRECNDYLEYICDDVLKKFYGEIFDNTNIEDSTDKNICDDNLNEYFKDQIKNKGLLESQENYKNKSNSQIENKKDLIEIEEENKKKKMEINHSAISLNRPNKISIKLENFKFMLQHQKRLYAYDIFVNNEEELFKYESHNLNISYRIQPLRDEDLHYLKNYDKIFVAFCRRDSSAFCDPIIISMTNESTIGEMKRAIFNKLKKIKATLNIEYSKIKFYIYSLIDYKPHKDNLLINSKDEEKISQFFKRGPRNVLVELLQMESDTSGKELTMG